MIQAHDHRDVHLLITVTNKYQLTMTTRRTHSALDPAHQRIHIGEVALIGGQLTDFYQQQP